jgi:hypothetical protein
MFPGERGACQQRDTTGGLRYACICAAVCAVGSAWGNKHLPGTKACLTDVPVPGCAGCACTLARCLVRPHQ